MIAIKKNRAVWFAALLFLVICLFGTVIIPTEFRVEMIVKITLISLWFMVVPSIRFGSALRAVLLASAIAVIATSSLSLDSKATVRAAVAIALLPAIFNVRMGPILFGGMLLALWLLQSLVRSRGLEITIVLFAAQMVLFKFWARPLLFLLFPWIYIIGMAGIGYSFIFFDGVIEATASNLARSSIIYSIIQGLPQNPLGYANEQDYLWSINPFALNLYSEDYNDPHNYFLSATVWGGLPLLLFSAWTFYAGIRDSLRSKTPDVAKTFAVSALIVFSSTSTLSLGNVIFMFFLIIFISHYRAPRTLE